MRATQLTVGLGRDGLSALLAGAALLIILVAVAWACLRVFLDLRGQRRETAALLRAIQDQLSRAPNSDHRVLAQVLLEGSLRDLRRLSGLVHASLEASVRELARVADSAAAAVDPEVLRPPRPAHGPAAPFPPEPLPGALPGALVVVRRDQARLFELIRQSTDRVVQDRRRADRRARREPLPTGRRRRERRRRAPATWDALGFAITASPFAYPRTPTTASREGSEGRGEGPQPLSPPGPGPG